MARSCHSHPCILFASARFGLSVLVGDWIGIRREAVDILRRSELAAWIIDRPPALLSQGRGESQAARACIQSDSFRRLRRWIDEPAIWVACKRNRQEAQRRVGMGDASEQDRELARFTLICICIFSDPTLRRRVRLLLLIRAGGKFHHQSHGDSSVAASLLGYDQLDRKSTVGVRMRTRRVSHVCWPVYFMQDPIEFRLAVVQSKILIEAAQNPAT